MKILLSIDQSPCSQAAVEAVKTRYKPAGSEVLIVHALDLLSPYAGLTALDPSAVAELIEGERRTAEALLKRAEEELRAAGFQVTWKLQEGDPRAVILETASEWQADRIVIGSHGKGAVERLMVGSVSLAILRHAHCSVEIVRAAGGK